MSAVGSQVPLAIREDIHLSLINVMPFMSIVYSTFEAKTKFSELLKLVQAGNTVAISDQGKPFAEIRPVAERQLSNDARLEEL